LLCSSCSVSDILILAGDVPLFLLWAELDPVSNLQVRLFIRECGDRRKGREQDGGFKGLFFKPFLVVEGEEHYRDADEYGTFIVYMIRLQSLIWAPIVVASYHLITLNSKNIVCSEKKL
jgi:hypothetical protein